MSNEEFKNRCEEANCMDGYFAYLSVYVLGLISVTSIASAYVGTIDLWIAIALIGVFFVAACFAVKEVVLDKFITCWSDAND